MVSLESFDVDESNGLTNQMLSHLKALKQTTQILIFERFHVNQSNALERGAKVNESHLVEHTPLQYANHNPHESEKYFDEILVGSNHP